MWTGGRHFDRALLERIGAAIDAEPHLSRRALSRRICEWMDWRSPNGALQDMSCRKALLELHRKGQVRLPEATNGHAFEGTGACAEDAPLSVPHIRCSLAELGAVEVVAVPGGGSEVSRVWNRLMDAYHYLGAGPLCGAQIRYLVRSPLHGWLGGLSFGSATLRLKAREEWIGWSDRARRANLGRVILNSRFLILPTVQVANLASHVLGRAVGRARQDWQQRYGVAPVLVETFVDPERFRGSSYQAANWVGIGQSAGRADAYANGKVSSGPKDIYVHPLDGDWQSILCREPVRQLSSAPPFGAANDWAEEEFGRLDVGDSRLRARLMELARDFFAQPGKPIPQACAGSQAKTKAAYRFCNNRQVDMQTVLFPHIEATVGRMQAHDVVLAVQDTSDLNYTHHPATQGLGPLGSIDDLTLGFKLHDTMAFTVQGTPIGLLDVQCWARDGSTEGKRDARKDLPIEDKESFKWLKSYRTVADVQKLTPGTMLVSVADREADIYELFAEASRTPAGPKLLVRAEKSRQRKVDQVYLWDHMAQQDVAGYQELFIPRKGSRRARTARLAVRFAPVELAPPKRATGPAVAVWAVYAHEVDYDPAEVKKPLSWLLLTTVQTTTFDQACERLRWYATRWGIEVYHRTLKSGCRIEDRQLGTAERLETCLAIDMVVAWRIYWLTQQGRETPDIPCDVILAEEEWQALHAFIHKEAPPQQPPPLLQAVRMIGKLGGFLGRKSDGEPGTTTLWRGLQRLEGIAAGWALALSTPGLGARASP